MKRFLFFTLLVGVLLPFDGVAQVVVNDSKRRNWSDDDALLGNVESIRIYSYYATATDYAAAGDIISDETYRFNSKGDVAENVAKYEWGVHKIVYTYDAARKTLNRKVYAGNNLNSTTTYEYNSKGKVVKTSTVDAAGTTESSCVYKYNTNGTLASTHDDDMTEWDADEETYYTYNAQGKCVKLYISNPSDEREEQYEYNSKGQLTKTKYYWESELSQISLYYYNAQGQLTEQVCDNIANDTKYKFVYHYDSKGNLIKRSEIDLKTNSVVREIKRDIVYR